MLSFGVVKMHYVLRVMSLNKSAPLSGYVTGTSFMFILNTYGKERIIFVFILLSQLFLKYTYE